MKGIPYKGPYVVRYNERTGQAMYIVGALDALGCPTVCDMPFIGENPDAEAIADLNATAKLLAESWERAQLSSTRLTEWPHGEAALEAAIPLPTNDRGEGRSAGFLLYCHVYEARWAAIKSSQYCPQWSLLSLDLQAQWEALAGNIATEVARTNDTRKLG